jgi:hypothetical protein
MSNPPVHTQPVDKPTAVTVTGPQEHGPGFVETVREQMKKAGSAIDRGMSSALGQTGQTLRATCPGCSKILQAPPNQLVECPVCKTHFQSPTVASRTAEVGKTVKEDLSSKFKHTPAPDPAGTSSAQGRQSGA